MTEKPLHVQVAEALGCKPTLGPDRIGVGPDAWRCPCDHDEHGWNSQAEGVGGVKRYDIDWSATGPLIEKYGITLSRKEGWLRWPARWEAFKRGTTLLTNEEESDTALIAACNMILKLKAKGRL